MKAVAVLVFCEEYRHWARPRSHIYIRDNHPGNNAHCHGTVCSLDCHFAMTGVVNYLMIPIRNLIRIGRLYTDAYDDLLLFDHTGVHPTTLFGSSLWKHNEPTSWTTLTWAISSIMIWALTYTLTYTLTWKRSHGIRRFNFYLSLPYTAVLPKGVKSGDDTHQSNDQVTGVTPICYQYMMVLPR
jgi:hypothetical protein